MKKGVYIQQDFWDAVEDLPTSAQDMYFGALVRLYFTGETEAPKHKDAKRCFTLTKDRVRLARQKSLAGSKQNDDQNDHQNSYQNDDHNIDSSKKRERESKRKNNIPASREEVSEWAKTNLPNLDVDAFCDFYESKGWKVGKNPMKDWQAAARNAVRKGWAVKSEEVDDEYKVAF